MQIILDKKSKAIFIEDNQGFFVKGLSLIKLIIPQVLLDKVSLPNYKDIILDKAGFVWLNRFIINKLVYP